GLREPPKRSVLGERPAPRQALLIVLDRSANRTFETVIDLGRKQITSWREVPGVQPMLLIREYREVPRLVRADPRWQAAMRRRGIAHYQAVMIDLWAFGSGTEADSPRLRRVKALSYLRGDAIN